MSRKTTVRRIEVTAANLQENPLNTANTLKCFSTALDESTDVLDTAQLLIFIRGIDEHFCITEELLSMESLKSTTTGQDIFNSVMHSLQKLQLCLDKLVSITTDGVPSLTGKHSGLIKRMNDKIQADYPLHKVLSFHCIIHQGSLCKSGLDFKHVVDPVVQAVNVIRPRGLNHRQFQDFFQDIDSDFSDVLHHTNVRWLSLRNMFKRVWELKEEIVIFFEMKDIVCDFSTKAENTEWMSDFAFATDIMQKMNELNKELQGKRVFGHDLYLEVKSFQTKLTLFAKQMSNENFAHFSLLQTQSVNATSAQRYSGHITGLREEFARRFADFNAMAHEFDLLKSPFSYDVETVTDELQMELTDLLADNALKSSFEKKPLIEFYESLHPEKFKNV